MSSRLIVGRLAARLLAVVALAVGSHFSATPAAAATFSVTTVQDAPNVSPTGTTCQSTLPGGPCTLRAAVQAANALGGTQAISLQAAGDYRLTVVGAGEDSGRTGDLDINGVAVRISNASGGSIAIDGNSTDRVFDLGSLAPGQLFVEGVTIQNGFVDGSGSGIRVNVQSTLTLINVVVSNNGTNGLSACCGGGISNLGALNITNSTINGNSAAGSSSPGAGGGIDNSGAATLNMVTISGNTAAEHGRGSVCEGGTGGGIINNGTMTLTDVTVSGNTSFGQICHLGNTGGHGGGIWNGGILNLMNTTMSSNNASDRRGGNITNISTLTVQSSVVTNARVGGNCNGPVTSLGDNLLT
jgi:CSLREA domain-containing protein